MFYVIDTNVPVAANGRHTHAGAECQLACIEFIQGVVSTDSLDVIALDDKDRLMDEYKGYLNFHGQPGVGDLFYKYLHDNMYQAPTKVVVVVVHPSDDQTRGFEELPINRLDSSDRKFLAVAVVSAASVVNALDTDWHQQAVLLDELNVPVVQLCPVHACAIR